MTISRMALLAAALWLFTPTPSRAQAVTAAAAAIDRAPSLFTTMDGIKIHYKSLGTGDTALVFVHGWACDLTFWRFQVQELSGRTRLVLVDLPGHGKSDKPRDTDYNLELFSRSIHAVLQSAGVRRAVLVGQSIGVPIIREFSRRFPGETQALAVLNGPLRSLVPFGADAAARSQRAAFDGRVQRLERASGPQFRELMTATAEGWFVPQTTTEVRQLVLTTLLDTPQYVAAAATAGTFEPQFWQEDPIRVPLLVILANIPAWARQNEQYVRTLAPQVEYHLMENVGHFVMLEQPQAVNQMLVQFLRKHGFMKS